MEIRKTITGAEPVLIADFKTFANTDYTDDDLILIPICITGAREIAEKLTGLGLIAQTVEISEVFTSDEIDPINRIRLPLPIHGTIDSVTVNGTAFTAFTTTGLNQKTVYLTGLTANSNGVCEVVIQFKCTGVCTSGIKAAILNIALDMYTNRSTADLNLNGIKLLSPYKIY